MKNLLFVAFVFIQAVVVFAQTDSTQTPIVRRSVFADNPNVFGASYSVLSAYGVMYQRDFTVLRAKIVGIGYIEETSSNANTSTFAIGGEIKRDILVNGNQSRFYVGAAGGYTYEKNDNYYNFDPNFDNRTYRTTNGYSAGVLAGIDWVVFSGIVVNADVTFGYSYSESVFTNFPSGGATGLDPEFVKRMGFGVGVGMGYMF